MSACPTCKTSYSGGARLCRNCGGALPASDALTDVVDLVLPNVGIRACGHCGLCVPARQQRCGGCKDAPLPRVVSPRPDGAYWVRVRCEYRCGGCAARVPLRLFADDGKSECVLCGNLQEQALFFWRMVLAHAHGVGDLAGPEPEGRLPQPGVVVGPRNPYRGIGLDVAELDHDRGHEDDDTPSELSAGPGHPLCLACSTPVDEGWSGGDSACAACGLVVHGARPSRAMPNDRGLVGILRRTSAAPAGGTIALRCATCTAPLSATPGSTQATCAYCKATSLVARPAPRVAGAANSGCWMLFRGPSRARAALSSHG